jgi:hypothetical protein
MPTVVVPEGAASFSPDINPRVALNSSQSGKTTYEEASGIDENVVRTLQPSPGQNAPPPSGHPITSSHSSVAFAFQNPFQEALAALFPDCLVGEPVDSTNAAQSAKPQF